MSTGGIIALGLFAFYMFILTSRARRKAEKEAEEEAKKEMKLRNASFSASLEHFAGLPIPEHTLCQVYSTPSRIEIVANGQQFNLTKEKIIDVSITTNTEIQKQLVSSSGGAVGGALLFGAVGALIGGRTKAEEVKQVKSYLIFTYQKENETKYVGFDISSGEARAIKFVMEFQQQEHKPLVQTNL
ncbi:MAG TPA: hypothetical protein GX745_07380 [Clostridiales bacterium]|nr:hypothetical protein [Clostridiales bacterium]